jgi:hypothetical protein
MSEKKDTFPGQSAIKEIHAGKKAINVAECCETETVDGVVYNKGEAPKSKKKKPATKE